jgi:hypothetical protein
MRKAHAIVLAGLGAALLTGVAAAASRDIHTLNVALPDGSVARIEYVGSVIPKVIVTPAPTSRMLEQFGMFDPAFDMEREMHAMMHEMDQVAMHPIAQVPGLNVAAYGNAPAGSTSVTIVSTSNGTQTCTRRTDVTSEGPGRAPKVTSSVSGNCSATPATPKAPNPA